MTETKSHKRTKSKAAGRSGTTEYKINHNRRLDALTHSRKRATEVERSGKDSLYEKAARRLKASPAKQRVLQTQQRYMDKAVKAMIRTGTTGTVKNMGGTSRRSVR